jgi:hypothetical protein
MQEFLGKGSCCIGLKIVEELLVTATFQRIEASLWTRVGGLTLLPHLLIPNTITGGVLGALVLLRLLLIASKHLVEEVELGLGNGCQQKEGPDGREKIAQHSV